MSGCCWPSCIGSTSTPESVLRFWFWLLDLCMDWHQHTSENFYIHTSSRVPRGHVIGLLAILHRRLKTKGDRALAIVTPRLWYSLPLSMRSVVAVGHTAKTKNFLIFMFYVLAICCEALWTFSWKMLCNYILLTLLALIDMCCCHLCPNIAGILKLQSRMFSWHDLHAHSLITCM